MRTVTCKAEVACEASKAYQEWLDVVWYGGGGMPGSVTVIERGDANTGLGSLRNVGGGVLEKILSVEVPNSVTYAVIGGPFPLNHHRGTVKFLAKEGQGKTTEIVWTCDYEPSIIGYVFLLGGWGIHGIINWSFNRMLTTLKAHITDAS